MSVIIGLAIAGLPPSTNRSVKGVSRRSLPGKIAMIHYLGVWNSPVAISDEEAGRQYLALTQGDSPLPTFDQQVYLFYTNLTGLYPENDLLPEAELNASPWASALDVGGGYVIMAIRPEKAVEIGSVVLTLTERYGLVCFDPQGGKVYIPNRLRVTPGTVFSAT